METTNNRLKHLPYVLTYSRLPMAIYYLAAAIFPALQNASTIGIILILAILTDIFDGIIARRLKVVTDHLRQLDSRIDTIFWFSLAYLLLVMELQFMKAHAVMILMLISLEIFVQVFGYFKFSKSIALHTYAAKAWAVLLTLTVLVLLWGQNAELIFNIMFAWSIVVQAEAVFILLKLKSYRVDVKSMFTL